MWIGLILLINFINSTYILIHQLKRNIVTLVSCRNIATLSIELIVD